MNLRSTSVRVLVAGSAACALTLGLAQPALAEQASPAGAQLEALDRGLVAVSTGEGVFLSWRLLGTEAGPATETGVSGPSFAVFRDGERIATVDDSTNYADADGSAASAPPSPGPNCGQPARASRLGRKLSARCTRSEPSPDTPGDRCCQRARRARPPTLCSDPGWWPGCTESEVPYDTPGTDAAARRVVPDLRFCARGGAH